MSKQRSTAARRPAGRQRVRRPAAPRSRTPSAAAASRKPFPVVGVGASAGGLEAFRHLLSSLPAAPGVALVLVPHLEPHHQSHLAELLARITPLPLVEAADGMRVEPDRVYVLPAASFLAVEDGALRLTPRAGRNLPIDFFLRSLAAGYGERAVGVVLSGTGADGTLGLQAVQAAGGVTFAQQPSSAVHDGMPRSAIAAAAADFVLPAEEIARELARLGHGLPASHAPFAAGPADAGDGDSWSKVLLLLDRATGTDFSLYKRATLGRRIARRMTALGIDTLEGYTQRLDGDPGEAKALHQELLISVTSFFRDEPTIELACDWLLQLLEARRSPVPPVRVWVPGCATGEEVYSLGICLLERASQLQSRSPGLQIFATDLSASVVAQARAGAFPESIAEQVSAERLERFFVKVEGRYQVGKTLRDLCVFARHDVTRDPPFSHLDLISCRNLLIYFEPRLQERVLGVFHYALNPEGLLLLGSSESAAAAPTLFETLDQRHKLYVAKPTRAAAVARPGAREPFKAAGPGAAAKPAERGAGKRTWAARETDRLLLERYTPAGVVVDERLDVLEFRGDTQPYLRQPRGQPTFNLLKMARKQLYIELHKALEEARQRNGPARRDGVPLRHQGVVRRVSIEVIPLPGEAGSERCMIVLFAPSEAAGSAAGAASISLQPPGATHDAEQGEDDRGDGRLAQLETELAAAAEYLHTVLRDHESALEQLQASNEELLSANEEFQSLNEELETTKEEIQSANEELATLNQELQDRNSQLGRLNDDLVNLLDSTTTAILMVDSALCLRRFTPSAGKLLKLRPADLGRALADLPTHLAGDLEDEVRRVVESLSIQEREVRTPEGSTFMLRIRPYRAHDNAVDGAVVMLIDVTELKSSGDRARRALEDTATEREALLGLEQHARERAELADRVKDEFLATISHELRGPLQAMAGWTHVLREDLAAGREAGRIGKGIAALDRAVKSQMRLIEDLLDHSRIVAGQLRLKRHAIDLGAVAELALESVRVQAEAKRLHLEIRRPGAAESLRMMGDPDRLQQVVVNLLSNAVKFTPAGGRIEVRLERAGTRLQLTVSDTGKGIRPDFLPHVFERFRQADAAPNRAQQGLGLGLAIVYHLVELHGGTVRADSPGEGRGATFTVSLPIPPLLDMPQHAAPAPAAAPPGAAAESPISGLRVLVVDDDDDSREALAALLEQHGARVLAAASAGEAIRSLDDGPPDLLVSDIGLPGVDGYDLIRRVRQRPEDRGGRLPALALTAYADPEAVRKALAAGFQMHLAKPVAPDDLLLGVAQLAGRLARPDPGQP